MFNKVLGNSLKTISVANSTLVGYGLMAGEKMESIPYHSELGAGAGFLLGSLAMYGVSRLESKKQVFPILIITGLLASTYPYSAPAIYKLMKKNELNKITYNYNDNLYSLQHEEKYQYDREKNQLAFKKYNSLIPNMDNKYTKQIKNLQTNKDRYIKDKYNELVRGKYGSTGKRTKWYSKQIQYAINHNWNNISIGNSIPKKELRQGKTDLAIMNVAEIFYYDRLKQLKLSEKELTETMVKAQNSPKITKAYNDYTKTSKEHILELRANLIKLIEKDVKLAESRIYKEEEIAEVMKIVGIIVEIILTPFLMWLSILESTPTYSDIIKNFKEWKRKNKTKDALIEAKEEVLIDTLDDLLKKHGLKMSLELKRILFLVQNIMKSDLNYLSDEDLKPSRFKEKFGNQFPKDIALPNYKKEFHNMKRFINFFKSNFMGDSSRRTTEDILFAFAKYKEEQKRRD